MMSDDLKPCPNPALEAACKAHCDYFGGDGWWETGLIADTKPKAIEAMQAAIAAWNTRPAPAATVDLRERVAELEAEVMRLKSLARPEWFYPSGSHESEACCDDASEVVDRLHLRPGAHVVEVNCATSLPSIWLAVKVYTPEEMEALETDDCEFVTEHATESDALSAIAAMTAPATSKD